MSHKSFYYFNVVTATTGKTGQENRERKEAFIVNGFSEAVTCAGAGRLSGICQAEEGKAVKTKAQRWRAQVLSGKKRWEN